jgi:hypothetical protein
VAHVTPAVEQPPCHARARALTSFMKRPSKYLDPGKAKVRSRLSVGGEPTRRRRCRIALNYKRIHSTIAAVAYSRAELISTPIPYSKITRISKHL